MEKTMTFAQFIRIETEAGGVACSNRKFIKTLLTKVSEDGKKREHREWRHKLIREGLYYRSIS